MALTEIAILGSSLGDLIEKLLTAAAVFLLFNAAVHLVYLFLNRMLKVDILWAQFIRTLLQIVIVVCSLIIILGQETVLKLVGGFSIGFGYAFQPVLLGAMNAIYLRSEDRFVGSTITIAGVTGVLEAAGLFHLRLNTGDKIVYVSNLKLTENISKTIKGVAAVRVKDLPAEPSAIRKRFRLP